MKGINKFKSTFDTDTLLKLLFNLLTFLTEINYKNCQLVYFGESNRSLKPQSNEDMKSV